MSTDRRRQLIGSGHFSLSIVRQCELVSVSRSTFYREPAPETALAAAYRKPVLQEFPFDAWANAAEDMLLARRARMALPSSHRSRSSASCAALR